MSTTLVRAASTRVRCAPMRGSVPPSWRQPAAIEFEKLPSSGIYFLGAGEDRPFETCFCEVIVMSFCPDKGEGDSEMSGRKPERGKTAPLPTCWLLLLFFATPWYGNKYKIPPAARPSKPLLDLLTRQRLFQWTLLRHESLAALAQHARTRPRWPPRPSLRIFFSPLSYRWCRSVLSRPTT